MGYNNKAMEFTDKVNNHVAVADLLPEMQAFTIEAWVKTTVSNRQWILAASGKPSTDRAGRFYFGYNKGFRFEVHQNDRTATSSQTDASLTFPTPNAVNGWDHLAVVYSADPADAYAELYVNGVSVNKTAYPAVPISAKPITLGVLNIGPTDAPGDAKFYGPYEGLVKEFRIWDKAMTAAEVAANKDLSYAKALETGATIDNLVLYYAPVEEGGAIKDSTGNGHTGTINGGVAVVENDELDLADSASGALGFKPGNYVRVPHHNALNLGAVFTIEMRLTPNLVRGGRRVLLRKGGSYQLGISKQGTLMWALLNINSGGWQWFESTLTLAAATDAEAVALTYDGTVATGHVGSRSQQQSFRYGGPLRNDNGNLEIGDHDNTAEDQGFDGTIHELRIWNTVRSATQIATWQKGETLKDPVHTPNLVALYPFEKNDTEPLVVRDLGPNGLTGYLDGGADASNWPS